MANLAEFYVSTRTTFLDSRNVLVDVAVQHGPCSGSEGSWVYKGLDDASGRVTGVPLDKLVELAKAHKCPLAPPVVLGDLTLQDDE